MKHLVDEEHKEGNFIKWLYQQEYLNGYQVHYQLDGGSGDDKEKENPPLPARQDSKESSMEETQTAKT